MSNLNFPVFKTKIDGDSATFNLEDTASRREYFLHKAGPEIEKLRDFMRDNTFVAFLLGKKNSGKGTYSKMFTEAVGKEYVNHISMGDVVRKAHKVFEAGGADKEALYAWLKDHYRGFMSLDESVDALLGRNTAGLLPTEFVLALIEKEISDLGRKSVFIDGFPRELDQVSYSLFFRSLMGYRDDPDFFIFIDLPDTIIEERMKYRVVCPKCQTPRNTKLLATKEVGWDNDKGEYYLKCDNPDCDCARMSQKEGDNLGMDAIRGRLQKDEDIMKQLLNLSGAPKVYLRNSIPITESGKMVDDYEITPAYDYERNEEGKVTVKETPWIVNDDDGTPSHSLLPAAVAVSLIKQSAQVLGL